MGFAVHVVKRSHPKAIYCGRPTPLGNPFNMRSEIDRDKVCDQYEQWFHANLIKLRPHLERLWIIGNQNGELFLGCYCAPKRCHCDTIKRYLDSLQTEQR